MFASANTAVMLFPTKDFANGMPYWSRNMVPILLGGCPSLDSLMMRASTSSVSYLHQDGARLLTGRTEWD
jgi:hypothetical protein